MLERKNLIDVLIGVMTVAMIVTGVILYTYKYSKNAPQTVSSPTLTNAEEAVFQKQLLSIIASKKEADCATLTNETYRLACKQFFKPTPPGVPLQTSPAEPMTEAQLTKLLKNSSSQLRPNITSATTTP
jgi:hypothetical protein